MDTHGNTLTCRHYDVGMVTKCILPRCAFCHGCGDEGGEEDDEDVHGFSPTEVEQNQ